VLSLQIDLVLCWLEIWLARNLCASTACLHTCNCCDDASSNHERIWLFSERGILYRGNLADRDVGADIADRPHVTLVVRSSRGECLVDVRPPSFCYVSRNRRCPRIRSCRFSAANDHHRDRRSLQFPSKSNRVLRLQQRFNLGFGIEFILE
jgi:hypothetical protein